MTNKKEDFHDFVVEIAEKIAQETEVKYLGHSIVKGIPLEIILKEVNDIACDILASIKESMEKEIENFSLDYGNSEVIVSVEKGLPLLDILVEAPNHYTVSVHMDILHNNPMYSDKGFNNPVYSVMVMQNIHSISREEACRYYTLNLLFSELKKLSTDDINSQFQSVWSAEFSEKNNFGPIEFADMLKEDLAFFNIKSSEIKNRMITDYARGKSHK